MIVSILTVLGAILYIVIQFIKKSKNDWADFTTAVMAMYTLLSITEVMIRFFKGDFVPQSELMKPLTLGFVIILFGAYQSLMKNIQSEKKGSG
jgi:hypothetical protein